MKLLVKILLIVFVLSFIGYSLYYFTKGISQNTDGPINPTDFEKHIQERAYNEVRGLPYDSAHAGFLSIMGEIQTEASICLNDGSKFRSDAEIKNATQIVFDVYAVLFNAYSNSYFAKSTWDENTLKEIKEEAEKLRNMKIVQDGTQVDVNLEKTIQNVDDYFDAMSIIRKASKCSKVYEIAEIKENAAAYKKQPLSNNKSLLNDLNNAEQNAKKAVISNIVNYCNSVLKKWNRHSEYIEWNRDFAKAYNRIKEYTDKYSSTSDLINAQTRLNNQDKKALEYYLELEQRNNE